ncbi:MAG: DUF4386 domain-containing protein [Acidobacteria bacterium]|nr:MAG: DUF4386 domain-containing protein [Acidobacteriota bacterium]
MNERIARVSPRFKARTAGAFWLMTIMMGAFAMFVGGRFVVSGDAAATAANILAHEPLFRLGVAADIIAAACYLAATLLVYDLLKPVSRNLSLLAAFFSLAGCAIGALGFLFHLAPLVVLGGAQYLSVFPLEQLRALASLIFFGLHCLLVGCLILRSTFLPRLVGALMVFAGLGWLTSSFVNVLSPLFGRYLFPYILVPGLLGEGSLTLWLLVIGMNVQRWEVQASAAGEWRS